MDKIKKQDFVEITYTGRLKEENLVFDTTDEKTAKDNNIYDSKQSYVPVAICIGENQIIKGLDKALEGKEPGNYKFEIKPEDAFGKKSAKLLKLIPANMFRKQGINAMPGLQVNIDGLNGIIKTASGGRCIVDFNHPLAGKELSYDVKVNKIVTDEKEKIEAILKLQLKKDEFDVKLENNKAAITLNKELGKPIQNIVKEMIVKLTKTKEVEFEQPKKSSAKKGLEMQEASQKENKQLENNNKV